MIRWFSVWIIFFLFLATPLLAAPVDYEATFDELWQAMPPKEQVRLVRLLIDSVNFDGPGGNVAITFHPTGLKALTETQLEHAK